MTIEKYIAKKIEQCKYLENLVVFPFGKWESITKKILNEVLKIDEKVIIDNYLSST